jgi:hypothetical protein
MRKRTAIILALMCSTFVFAQKAERVESIITNSYESEWYAAQMDAWQKKVNENPNDQWAWRNLFRATYYYEQKTGGWGENQDESRTADIIRKMEAALPDSYVLNLSKGRFCLSTDSAAKRGDNIYQAIKYMPDDACAEDVNYLACRLWSIDPENKEVNKLFARAYQKRYFPLRIMQYNRNMLLSMQSGALYFANGDVVTAPMKMIQEALGERQDVTVIPISFLHADPYLNALYKRLNIKPLNIDVQDYGKYGGDWYKHYEADIIMYLINETQRPTYFSTDILSQTVLNKDSIYNEGILLKYSPKQYNNFAVAMHNVKEVYNLEYLAEPDLVYDSWVTSQQSDLNNVTLLSNLISKFRKKGDTIQADRLYKILDKCIERSPLFEHSEAKEAFMKKLREEADK